MRGLEGACLFKAGLKEPTDPVVSGAALICRPVGRSRLELPALRDLSDTCFRGEIGLNMRIKDLSISWMLNRFPEGCPVFAAQGVDSFQRFHFTHRIFIH